MFEPFDKDPNVGCWQILKEKIYERKGGIRNLDLATTRMLENKAYMDQVNQAFARGKKPPMRFSDDEKYIISQMLKRMDIKKKRAAPHRNMTNVNLLMKSGINTLNQIAKNQSIEQVDQLNDNKYNPNTKSGQFSSKHRANSERDIVSKTSPIIKPNR